MRVSKAFWWNGPEPFPTKLLNKFAALGPAGAGNSFSMFFAAAENAVVGIAKGVAQAAIFAAALAVLVAAFGVFVGSTVNSADVPQKAVRPAPVDALPVVGS